MTLDDALKDHRLLALRGPNFSGRTQLLRDFCNASRHERGRIYLGPEVYNALSGLAMTVRQEIELHAGRPLSAEPVAGLAELQLTSLLDQNPGLLSGGEQAALAILCGLALKPAHLAIDCALEQLDARRLAVAMGLLQGAVIADNRMDEWDQEIASVDVADVLQSPAPPPPVPPLAPEKLAALPPMHTEPIELRNLTAGYPNRPGVLENLSAQFEPGQIHVLLGENGAGKSTCAKILCGVLTPAAGQIIFGDKAAEPWKSPGKNVGYHLQNPDVGLFESTVALELGRAPSAAAVMEAFGLAGVAQTNPLSLPFPVRKRVSLAATIAAGQPWMFLDEPTLGADSAAIAALARIAQHLADSGRGVILVSHSRKFRDVAGGKRWSLDHGRLSPAVL